MFIRMNGMVGMNGLIKPLIIIIKNLTGHDY